MADYYKGQWILSIVVYGEQNKLFFGQKVELCLDLTVGRHFLDF